MPPAWAGMHAPIAFHPSCVGVCCVLTGCACRCCKQWQASGMTCCGCLWGCSQGISGHLDPAVLDTYPDENGTTFAQAARSVGFNAASGQVHRLEMLNSCLPPQQAASPAAWPPLHSPSSCTNIDHWVATRHHLIIKFKILSSFSVLQAYAHQTRWDTAARPIEAFVELHIEQGPHLEAEGVDIGIVMAIAAPSMIRITFTGAGGHGGGMPMSRRYPF